MDVVVDRNELKAALTIPTRVANAKSAIPILAHVMLTAESRALTVAGSDLYRSVTVATEAETTKRGSITTAAKDLCAVVEQMPPGPLQITGSGNRINVKAVGRAVQCSLVGLPGGDFPNLPKVPETGWQALDFVAVRQAFARVAPIISQDETRAHVNSALWRAHGGTLTLVGTDGHRLALARVPFAGEGPDRLIPRLAVYDLMQIPMGSRAEIAFDEKNVHFRCGTTWYAVKLTDASYPPFEQVIPDKVHHEARVPREALIAALRFAAVLADDRTGGVRIKRKPGSVLLSVDNAVTGNRFGDEVIAEYDGEADESGFRARYLIDALEHTEGHMVRLGFGAVALDPVTVESAESSYGKGDFLAVVMPLRI